MELIETIRTHEDGYDCIGYELHQNGEIIGWASVLASETAYVERIDIAADHRGQGAGTWMLKELSRRFGSIYLAPDNENARRLYARLGCDYTGSDAEAVDQGLGVYEI